MDEITAQMPGGLIGATAAEERPELELVLAVLASLASLALRDLKGEEIRGGGAQRLNPREMHQ
jgi:hypothetical protein